MEQIKISIKKEHHEFISHYSKYGFKDKSELVRKAIDKLKEEIELEKLKSSAQILNSIYSKEKSNKEWIDDSIKEWPDEN
ncbi:MAG: hypothetical protein AB1432_09180 [Bacteroidota bacterium]